MFKLTPLSCTYYILQLAPLLERLRRVFLVSRAPLQVLPLLVVPPCPCTGGGRAFDPQGGELRAGGGKALPRPLRPRLGNQTRAPGARRHREAALPAARPPFPGLRQAPLLRTRAHLFTRVVAGPAVARRHLGAARAAAAVVGGGG